MLSNVHFGSLFNEIYSFQDVQKIRGNTMFFLGSFYSKLTYRKISAQKLVYNKGVGNYDRNNSRKEDI